MTHTHTHTPKGRYFKNPRYHFLGKVGHKQPERNS
uniref:Uncharacterized protein n=1 Tax=Anguilla anguilla TaxID=7936 RepID=A0A0E9PTI2_ANGAN